MLKKLLLKIICFTLLLNLLFSCSNLKDKNTKENININKENNLKQPAKNKSSNIETNYKIAYTLYNKRFDKGINFYVLLDPIDLKNTEFIENIKAIINVIAKENGPKISIDFYDDEKMLELDYKFYGDMSLGRNLTANENKLLEFHHIAGFSGKLSTDLFENTLYYFPNANDENDMVGKFVSIIEYNPK